MKANELMIGDWVYSDIFKKPWILQPSDIRKILDSPEEVFDDDKNFKYIHPLPLTEEILMENGFYVKSHFVEWQDDPSWTYEHKSARVEYDEINKVVVIKSKLIPTIIKYVHELQHALRLCGLNDLADNFKVV